MYNLKLKEETIPTNDLIIYLERRSVDHIGVMASNGKCVQCIATINGKEKRVGAPGNAFGFHI